MQPSILVIGDRGQLGRALQEQLGAGAMTAGRSDVDLLNPDFTGSLDRLVANRPLSAVINATAYTQVDKAEGEGRADAFRVNGDAVGELAQWCATRNLPMVHFSTDYVFDGSGDAPRGEDVAPAPVNAYGKSKLAGERAIESVGGRYLIFRTSWVYDAHGKNFFNTILRLLGEKESLNVVADQVGAPTYAPHLARASLEALEQAISMPKFPSGVYHLCNAGETSWCGFAQAIFALARTADSRQSSAFTCQHINPIPTSAYPLPAPRPLNSRLDCSRARSVLGVAMPHWEEGLKECIRERYDPARLPDSRPHHHPAQGAGG